LGRRWSRAPVPVVASSNAHLKKRVSPAAAPLRSAALPGRAAAGGYRGPGSGPAGGLRDGGRASPGPGGEGPRAPRPSGVGGGRRVLKSRVKAYTIPRLNQLSVICLFSPLWLVNGVPPAPAPQKKQKQRKTKRPNAKRLACNSPC